VRCWHRVKDVQKKEKTKPRPQALNTVEMLRVASSGLGMTVVLSANNLHVVRSRILNANLINMLEALKNVNMGC